MKYRIILISIIVCVIASAAFLIAEVTSSVQAKPDLIEINRIKSYAEAADGFSDFSINSKYDFTAVDAEGTVLFSTKPTDSIPLAERLNRAVTDYDAVIDFAHSETAKGKIIIYTGQALQGNKAARKTAVVVPFSILSVLLVLYFLYMRYYLYAPFKRLKVFAQDIAAGNLDLALPMDKDNLFGEFTESFDIMREELKAARERALAEERSKKELIATLSHDIKTPVSIVRAASELLEIGEADEKKLINIRAIQTKALEIDTLVTDLFSSALEDLSELKVSVQDIASEEIRRIIIKSDPLKKLEFDGEIPECLVKTDSVRLGQVFGNIVSNSYKYANTAIQVSLTVYDGFLKVSFKDFGNTLHKDELPLLTSKFYRGKNSKGKQGAGLGLYICSRLLERMGGGMDISLEQDGLKVTVILCLS